MRLASQETCGYGKEVGDVVKVGEAVRVVGLGLGLSLDGLLVVLVLGQVDAGDVDTPSPVGDALANKHWLGLDCNLEPMSKSSNQILAFHLPPFFQV